MDLDKAIDILIGTVTDQRTHNIRYRQNELQKLHAALLASKDRIQDALCKTGLDSHEVETEFFLTTDGINQFYHTLDFKVSLEEEYLVTRGRNNTSRRVGIGLVAIRPKQHSRLYSTIIPLAAAVTAGNCVLLEVKFLSQP